MTVSKSLVPKPIDAVFDNYEKTSGYCIEGAETKVPYQAEIIGYKTWYRLEKDGHYCDPFISLGYMSISKCAADAKRRTGTTKFQKDEYFYYDKSDTMCALCKDGFNYVKSGGFAVYKIVKVPVFKEGEEAQGAEITTC